MMLAIIYRLGNFTVPFQQEDGDEDVGNAQRVSRATRRYPFLKIAAVTTRLLISITRFEMPFL